MIADRPLRARTQRLLEWTWAAYGERAVLACSFGGASGMVLLDMIAQAELAFPVFYLDTGLLFAETYSLVERVRERYGIGALPVRAELDLAAQAERFGDALWARDPDRCCALRKVEPQRAFLAGYEAWITGVRRDQTASRAATGNVEWDERSGGLAKINPLAGWTENDVWAYVRERDVPYSALHDRGYPSVGCTPCTRPVRPGEDPRAGRWAGFAKTECGLHGTAGEASR